MANSTDSPTTKDQTVRTDQGQLGDNDYLWEILFVRGDQADARPVTFGGRTGVNPLDLWTYLLSKQEDADAFVNSLPSGAPPLDRCVFCRHPFGTTYEDAFFGPIEIRRNGRNRNYCDQCDYFIQICPGQATLTLPVLVVDVKNSREIRRHLTDLRQYSRLLKRFHQIVVTEIQRNYGFVINTIGDAVLAVWPSGFTPRWMRESQDWDATHPARIATRCAIQTAAALALIAPEEFDGNKLPFRGAVDTTEMCLFAVNGDESEDAREPDSLPGGSLGGPTAAVETVENPIGPTAVDIAGEAVEVASEFSSHVEAEAGRMYISRRTDVEAGNEAAAYEYTALGGSPVMVRAI